MGFSDDERIVLDAEDLAELLFEDPWGEDEADFKSVVESLIASSDYWHPRYKNEETVDIAINFANGIFAAKFGYYNRGLGKENG